MRARALRRLHRRLRRLRRRRRIVRWGTAYSALAVAALWALGAAFAIDWYFWQSMDLWQRLFLEVVCGAAVVYALVRYTWPWLGRRENELDMALLVQQQEHIDTDLVAALEFEWPEAASWGSVALERAVIAEVAGRERKLHVRTSLPSLPLRRRLFLLAVTAAVWGGLVWLAPQHVAVFFDRLLLGSQQYPLRTHIDLLVVNGRKIEPEAWGGPERGQRSEVRGQGIESNAGGKPAGDAASSRVTENAAGSRVYHVRWGKPVRLEVHGSGEIPDAGRATVVAASGARMEIALEPLPSRPRVFVGELPRLVEPVRCRFYLGDSRTGEGELVATPLPVVELEAEVVPPAYIAGSDAPQAMSRRGMRQFEVIEGSQVRMKIRSDKPLKEAVLTLDEQHVYPLVRDASSGGASETWALREAKTPLERIDRLIAFQIQVTDAEDQQLDEPIQGVISVESDLPPQVTNVSSRTRLALPTAAPRVHFNAADDHGLARVWFAYEITRPTSAKNGDEIRKGEVTVYEMPASQKPELRVEETRKFALESLGLAKGDTVKVTVWAKDFRGPTEGKSTPAETPLVFEVTDAMGILAGVAEGDEESARQLKTMWQREMGIGESP